MRSNNRNLKLEARCALRGNHATFAGITALMTALNLLLNYLALSAAPYGTGVLTMLLYFGCSILVNIVYYILLAGLYRIYLDLSHEDPIRWKALFSAFTEHPEPIAIFSVIQFGLSLLLTQVFIWVLGLCLDCIFYGSSSGITFGDILTALFALLIAFALYVFLKLSLAMFLFVRAADPWLSFREMLKDSVALMKGRRWSFLYLILSFLGIKFLCILSFGIGFLFADPYQYTTEALFYKKISD